MSTSGGSAGIVVGVDESEGAAAALRWAAGEAQLRRVPLTAVLAWGYLDQHHVPAAPFDPHYGEHDARAALEAVVAQALGPDATPTIELRTECDLAVPALLRAAEGAVLLAVGARGTGGFHELLLGSVSSQLVHHARLPVAVVREVASPAPGERVVVGVDGSPQAAAALAWAVEDARVRSARLTVVHAGARAVPATLDAAVDAVDTTGVAVERLLAADSPAPALLAAAADADLVVVGSRGRGGFREALLGSVTHHVTQHALCPVVVVRSR
jgi:nucleotide-binding universal stress UspA family protein